MTQTHQFWGTSAMVPGFRHAGGKQNSQDQAGYEEITHAGHTYRFGFAIDGCGSSLNSEFGAIMAKDCLYWDIPQLIQEEALIEETSDLLAQRLLSAMLHILPKKRPPQAVVQFILDKLLFTIAGFIQGPETTVLFYLGDPVFYLNGNIILGLKNKQLQQNRPDYLAYHLIPQFIPDFFQQHTHQDLLEHYVPKQTFFTTKLFTHEVKRLAVGTDAWIEEESLLHELWDFDPAFPQELQERLNIWSGRPFRTPIKRLHFEDDASVAILQQVVLSTGEEASIGES